MQISVVFVIAVAHSLPQELIIVSREHKSLGGGGRLAQRKGEGDVQPQGLGQQNLQMTGTWKYFGAFYLSKIFVDLPMQIVLPIFTNSIVFFLVGFNDGLSPFVLVCLSTILLTFVNVSLMYVLSSVLESTEKALQAGPGIVFSLVMFNGFLINAQDIATFWKTWLPMEKISFFRFSFRSLLIAIFGFDYPDFEGCEGELQKRGGCFKSGMDVLDYFFKETTVSDSFLGISNKWHGEMVFSLMVLLAYTLMLNVIGCYIFVSKRPKLASSPSSSQKLR
eukprot:GDKJ01005459.1.p1 GENE.GDKJ01005459.1~~GDKJ01005459.1.p1  ORF type:complete len:278 (+),score=59.15 GDKJ01005459.1:162-995(+)